MIPVNELISLFQTMYEEHWSYVWGKAEEGCVDCSGAFDYAYRQFGLRIAHGSNSIARKYISGGLLPISCAEPGMAAFKCRIPGESGYDLPDKFLQGGASYNGDLNDYYHIGLVDEDSQYVLNAKGEKYGFCRDALTKKNGWDYVAYLKNVEYTKRGEKVSYQAKVVGGKLNLREGKSSVSERLCMIPDGTILTVTEESGDWARVSYDGKTGWVVAQYLEKIGQDADVVTVPKAVLQKMYDEIGDWLGLRG